MTLPDERVFSMLANDFVVGWGNIKRADYVGYSHGYSKNHVSVGTTNGAGPHNVQIFVLSPDLVVLHALPGFWHPEDLARELRFAKVIARLWADDSRTRAQKVELYRRLQLREPKTHPKATYARSTWQSFDVPVEVQKQRRGPRDTLLLTHNGKPIGDKRNVRMKPINVLVHERMARRAFLPFDQFDVEAFIDYGRHFYDNNMCAGRRGVKFTGQLSSRQRRATQARRIQKRQKAREKSRM